MSKLVTRLSNYIRKTRIGHFLFGTVTDISFNRKNGFVIQVLDFNKNAQKAKKIIERKEEVSISGLQFGFLDEPRKVGSRGGAVGVGCPAEWENFGKYFGEWAEAQMVLRLNSGQYKGHWAWLLIGQAEVENA